MKLVLPAAHHYTLAVRYINQFAAIGYTSIDGGTDIENKPYLQWLDYVTRILDFANPVEGMYPGIQYFSMNDNMTDIIGMVNLRFAPDCEYIENIGHIGYSIAPKYWGRGYGTEQCKLALNCCRSLGLDHVFIVCSKNNPASRAVILRNGGVLYKEFFSTRYNETLETYLVKL